MVIMELQKAGTIRIAGNSLEILSLYFIYHL